MLQYKGLSWQAISVKSCGEQSTNSDLFQQRVPLGKIPALVVVQKQEGEQMEVGYLAVMFVMCINQTMCVCISIAAKQTGYST